VFVLGEGGKLQSPPRVEALQELPDERRDLPTVRLEREVAGIQQVQLGVGEVATVGFGSRPGEERVEPAPNDQGGRRRSTKNAWKRGYRATLVR
jgi:hypothetical protein